MRSRSSSAPAARLIRRLDQAVWRMRFDLLLRLLGIGCCVAAVLVVMTAGLDCWLGPDRLWLGGSVVWTTTGAVVAWSAGRLAGHQCGRRGQAGWWPTRLTIAQRWEQALPDGGSSISAAAGFLEIANQSALGAVGANSRGGQLEADFIALAIQRAEQAVRKLPDVGRPFAGCGIALLGLATVASLLFSASVGPPSWRSALVRQLAPAVGGWPPATHPLRSKPPALPPLAPQEIPVATRQLIARLTVVGRAVDTASFEASLERLAGEARQLAERLPTAARAGMIRTTATQLSAVVLGAARVDRVAGVKQLAVAGQAAEQLAAAATTQHQLAEQLPRLLARQPGLIPAELPPAGRRQLLSLVAAQQRLNESTAAAVADLRKAGLDASQPEGAATLTESIGQNRLAVAAAGAAGAARRLAGTVVSLGLDLPESVGTAAGTMSDSLTLAIVGLSAVTRELDRETLEPAAAQMGTTGQVAVDVAGAVLPVGAGVQKIETAADRPSFGGLPGGAGSSANGGEVAPTLAASPVASGLAGPRWQLASPTRSAVGRIAVDDTLPPGTAAAFSDYLERLVPSHVNQELPADRASP